MLTFATTIASLWRRPASAASRGYSGPKTPVAVRRPLPLAAKSTPFRLGKDGNPRSLLGGALRCFARLFGARDSSRAPNPAPYCHRLCSAFFRSLPYRPPTQTPTSSLEAL